MRTVGAVPLGIAAEAEKWIELFDGHSLNGWRPSENKSSWKVVDGTLAADERRSHLFYTGQARGADFRNFELEVELTTKPQCNSGIYFHTAYQEMSFPEKGFQIRSTTRHWGTADTWNEIKPALSKGSETYTSNSFLMKTVPDSCDGTRQKCSDSAEPVIPAGEEKRRFLDHGTFALRCHNDGSEAFYKSVRVRPLPDNLPAYTGGAPA